MDLKIVDVCKWNTEFIRALELAALLNRLGTPLRYTSN